MQPPDLPFSVYLPATYTPALWASLPASGTVNKKCRVPLHAAAAAAIPSPNAPHTHPAPTCAPPRLSPRDAASSTRRGLRRVGKHEGQSEGSRYTRQISVTPSPSPPEPLQQQVVCVQQQQQQQQQQ